MVYDRYIDECNKIKHPGIDPYTYGQLIFFPKDLLIYFKERERVSLCVCVGGGVEGGRGRGREFQVYSPLGRDPIQGLDLRMHEIMTGAKAKSQTCFN